MQDRGFTPFDVTALSTMPAKQLIGLRDRLLRLEESPECSDLEPSEIHPDRVYFKNDPRWDRLHKAVVAEFSRRENVAKATVRAVRSLEQARRKQRGGQRPTLR